MILTEQWKKGELPCGHYYVIFDKNDTPEISRCVYKVIILSKPEVRDFEDFGVEEVLAPVPSYEEWQDTENRSLLTTEFSNEIDELNEENQKLKDIISKMCMELVDPDDDMSNGLAEYFNQDLLLEIHEVLK